MRCLIRNNVFAVFFTFHTKLCLCLYKTSHTSVGMRTLGNFSVVTFCDVFLACEDAGGIRVSDPPPSIPPHPPPPHTHLDDLTQTSHTSIHTYTTWHTHLYPLIRVDTHLYDLTHTYTNWHTCTYTTYTNWHTSIYTPIRLDTHLCTPIRLDTHLYTPIRLDTHLYTPIRLDTHPYDLTHIYTHPYDLTQTYTTGKAGSQLSIQTRNQARLKLPDTVGGRSDVWVKSQW